MASTGAGGAIELTQDDIDFLVSLLRQSPQPMTTQQLIDALRERGRAA